MFFELKKMSPEFFILGARKFHFSIYFWKICKEFFQSGFLLFQAWAKRCARYPPNLLLVFLTCILKSSSAAECTRRWLGNTNTCPYVCFNKQQSHHQLQDTLDESLTTQVYVHTCGHVLVLPSQHVLRPTFDDEFAICQNARIDMCLCCQACV